MSKEVKRRVGTTAEHSTFAGAAAEITVDETLNTVVVHDGSTAGGFPLMKDDMSNYDGSTIADFLSTGIDDNATSLAMTIDSSENIGIGVASPDGRLHIHTATAGGVTAGANADDLVVENSTVTGMSFLSAAGFAQSIFFGDADDNDIGKIIYDHGDNSLAFTTNATTAMTLSNTQVVNINSASNLGQFNVKGAGTVNASFSRDDNFGDSTQNVLIHIGNSGDDQGNFRIHYFNNTVTTGQIAKLEFNPRNAADDGADLGGQIVFTKDSDLSGTIRFIARNNAGAETAVVLDGDDVVFSSNNTGVVGLGRTGQRWKDLWLVNNNNTNPIATLLASNEGYNSGELLQIKTNTSPNTNSMFIECATDVDGSGSPAGPDVQFKVRFDGEVTCDGSFTGGGADYADYFEWADGNPNEQDRVGYSVITTSDRKIELAYLHPGVEPIGVISGKPAAIGNAAGNKWDSKYLKDDFNRYVFDDNKERIVNPDYDPEQTYIPREERPEWDAVGLVGRLPTIKGQPVASTWIKLGDISSEVEEWLVR